MRKQLLWVWFSHCLLTLTTLLAHGQTPVGGPVEGTWTLDGSPYFVISTIIIDPGKSLTIEPGVVVQFDTLSTDSIIVYGKLLAVGTGGPDADSIYFWGDGKSLWRGIWFMTGSDPESRLEFVSIQYPQWGVVAWHCNPTISHSTIRAQSVGIWGYYSNFVLSNSTIEAMAEEVTAIRLHHSNSNIRDCSIVAGNTSSNYNVIGLRCVQSDPEVRNSTFEVMGEGVAYGMWLEDTDKANIYYNLIDVQSAILSYGFFLNHSTYPNLVNNTVVVKSGNFTDKCVYLQFDSNPLIENCILYGDGTSQGVVAQINCYPTLRYDDFYGHTQDTVNCSPVVGCIFLDPLFEDPANGDFDLTAHSPCIDAGNPTSPLDPDSTRADMGCYPFLVQVDVNSPGDVWQPPSSPILDVFPNPFNSESRIQLIFPSQQQGELTVYDQAGRLISTIKRGRFEAGQSQFTWDASHLSAGIYLMVLRTTDATVARRLALIR